MNKNNSRKIASFDIDAQKGFTPLCPDELPVPGGDEIAGPLNDMAAMSVFRVGSKDAHSPQASWVVDSADKMLQRTGLPNADLTWVSHCVPGTAGFELLDGLPSPNDYNYFVWKGVETDLHPYGACYHDIQERRSTGVIQVLRAEQITTVIAGGLALDFCVKATVMQLINAGFEVILYLPACKAIDQKGGAEAVETMRAAGAIIIDDKNALSACVGA